MTHLERRDVIRILGAITVTALAIAGGLAWRALDVLATASADGAAAAVALVGLFTAIAMAAAGALAGVVTTGRED